MRTRSPRSGILATVVIMAALVLVSLPVAADEGDELVDQYRESQERQAELAASLDALTASHEEVKEALALLDERVATQEAALADAQSILAEATIVAEKAASDLADKAAELERLQKQLDAMVVEAFMNPPQTGTLNTLIDSDSPTDAEAKEVYLDTKVTWDANLIEEVDAARRELEVRAAEAEAAEAKLTAQRDEVAAQLAELNTSREQHAILAAAVEERIAQDYAAVSLLSEHDKALAAKLAEQAKTLVTQLSGVGPGQTIPLISVRGIKVHERVAPQLEQLLEAAEAEGVRLDGWGYRTTAEQINLRRAHCGPDPVAIYEMAPAACSPPTARPGTSMHEIGLAVDFTVGGQVISSHDQPAFTWLAEHADGYGFANLPSEPWHWSVNGE